MSRPLKISKTAHVCRMKKKSLVTGVDQFITRLHGSAWQAVTGHVRTFQNECPKIVLHAAAKLMNLWN